MGSVFGKVARGAIVVGVLACLVFVGAYFFGGVFYGTGSKEKSDDSAVKGLERLIEKGPEVLAAVAKSKDAQRDEENAKKKVEEAKANTKAAQEEVARLVESLEVPEVLQALKALKFE